jgi:hypothetical protein
VLVYESNLSTVYDTYRSAGNDIPFLYCPLYSSLPGLLLSLDTEVGPELTPGDTGTSGLVNGVSLEARVWVSVLIRMAGEKGLTNDTFTLGTSDFVNLLDGRAVYHQSTFTVR